VNILLIGGSGFLGLHLLNDLQLSLPTANIYISSARREMASDNVVFVNYESAESVEALLALTKPDYILHLASCCVRDSADSSLRKGRIRDDNILKALAELELSLKFIFVASMAVFAMNDKKIRPLRYDPESNYGLEKVHMINKLVDFSAGNEKFSFKIVYPSSIYGKGQNGKMFLPQLLDNIQQRTLMVAYGGNKKRDFVHVKDVSHALVKLVLAYDSSARTHIFLHSFILHKIADIADIVCRILQLDPNEIIFFEDSKEDIERDIMDFQVVSEQHCSRNGLTNTIPIFEGLEDMFVVN
jgi:nucleoside-diphosphate-sugar epimerase